MTLREQYEKWADENHSQNRWDAFRAGAEAGRVEGREQMREEIAGHEQYAKEAAAFKRNGGD